MSHRWNLPDGLSAEEQRKARRNLRAMLAAGIEEPTYDGIEAFKQSTATTSHNQAAPAIAKGSKKVSKASINSDSTSNSDTASDTDSDDDESADSEDDSESNVWASSAQGEALFSSLQQQGLSHSPNMTDGYGFEPFTRKGKANLPNATIAQIAEAMVNKYFARWSELPTEYNTMPRGNILLLGPIPNAQHN